MSSRGRADGARDGALEVAVVAAVELVLVAARCACAVWVSVGGCMSPDPGEPAGASRRRRVAPPSAGRACPIIGAAQPRPTAAVGSRRRAPRASTASAVGSGFGSRASSMRRAIVSIVCGVLADGVERAVFAPAGDVRDRLAADVEADRAEHAVGDAVDEHLGLLAAVARRSRGRARGRSRGRACGPGGCAGPVATTICLRLGSHQPPGPSSGRSRISTRVAELGGVGDERGDQVVVAVAGDRLRRRGERDGLLAGQRVGHADVEDRDGAEEDLLLAGLLAVRRRAA